MDGLWSLFEKMAWIGEEYRGKERIDRKGWMEAD